MVPKLIFFFSKSTLLPFPELQTFIKLEFKLSSINQILSCRAFLRSAETSKLFRQLCVRGARYSGAVPQFAAGRPHAPHARGADGRITATMSGCTVRVRSLQRPWVVFSVGGARKQRALLRRAKLRQPSRYHGTPLRHATAVGGSRHAAQ